MSNFNFLKAFQLTASKLGALMIIGMAPFFLTESLLIGAWTVAAGILGWKQYLDKNKKVE
jgi:hypothetical protein